MATVTPALLDQLADSHQRSMSLIQIAAEAAAVDLWLTFGRFGGQDEDEWVLQFWTLISAAANAVSVQALNYLQTQAHIVGIALPFPTPSLDWLREDFDQWAVSPLVRSRFLLSEGALPREAIEQAAERVRLLVSSVTREAEVRAFEEIVNSIEFQVSWEFEVDETNPSFAFPRDQRELDRLAKISQVPVTKDRRRWKRIPQGGACGWCRMVADRLYSVEAKERRPLGDWHAHCRCTWRVTTRQEEQRFEPSLSGGKWRSVVKERAATGEGQ